MEPPTFSRSAKSAVEAHRILVQTYDDNALSDTTCRDWFRRFKNNDFELEDKERSGAPKKFQDKELEQLLDEDPSQTLSELGKILQVDESTVSKRLKGLGMIQKQGHWVPIADKRDLFDSILDAEIERQPVAKLLTFSAPFSAFRVTSSGSVIAVPPTKLPPSRFTAEPWTAKLRGIFKEREKNEGKKAPLRDDLAHHCRPRSRDEI
ncbi:MOS1T transposase, partial [Pseudoatta argentina]